MSHTRGTSSTSKHQLNWTADKTITTQSTIKIATTPALAIDTANTWRSKMMIGIARARRTDSRLSIPYVSESIKECAQREREREEEEREFIRDDISTVRPVLVGVLSRKDFRVHFRARTHLLPALLVRLRAVAPGSCVCVAYAGIGHIRRRKAGQEPRDLMRKYLSHSETHHSMLCHPPPRLDWASRRPWMVIVA